jgi:hypothetical protein
MAGLLRQVIGGGVPPSAARLPMSPEEVAASYDEIDDRRKGDREGDDQDPPWDADGASAEENAAAAE